MGAGAVNQSGERGLAEVPEGGFVTSDADPRLDVVEARGMDGFIHDALAELQRVTPLRHATSVRARCMLGWLWYHLGAERAALRLCSAEHRRAPDHASAVYHRVLEVMRLRGPVEAWLKLRDYVPPPSTPEVLRAEVADLRARLLSYLGDHRAAKESLAAASREALGEPRYAVTSSILLERRDRRDEARELVADALERHPQHRLLIQQLSGLLLGAGEQERALELLTAADASRQAPVLTHQLAFVQHELGRFDDELASLDRLEQLASLADGPWRRQLAGRRAENAYRRGDAAAFERFAELSEIEYLQGLVPRVRERGGTPDRLKLELGPLLQEPMGCAPASLTIVSRYFGDKVDHVDVADQICYEGTASHSERSWVEQRGWLSRELTVDFSTAEALIERGVPFLLVTVEIGSAHAQVVVGVDRTRRTLITRDPMTPHLRELDADSLFEGHRAYGPRGHVLLPPEQAYRLDGLELPDYELHDLAHALRQALERHDLAAARARLGELEARAASHHLTLWARRTLAQLDDDPYAIKACSEALLERFPDDHNAELSVLGCLSTIGTEQEQEQRLTKKLAQKDAPWVYHERLAMLIGRNAERLPEALRSLRRAERRVPTRGRTLSSRADLEAAAGRGDLALCLRRAASTLEPTDDDLARWYFEAAFQRGDAAPALEWLRDRVERYEVRSGAPATVAFTALEWLDRNEEAFELLSRAVEQRPKDGALLSFAAAVHARYQRPELASALLARTRDLVSPAQYELTAARLAELAGDLKEALARHEALLREQPLAMSSQSAAASLRGQLFGFERAREELARVCAEYPTHCGLRELYAGWLRGHDPALVLPELTHLLALQPAHGWARRERALVLSDLGRHDEAIAEAEAAERLAPQHPSSQRVLATALAAAGQRTRALEPARRAVELEPDDGGAVSALASLAGSLDEQRDLLGWMLRTLLERSVTGNGLWEWYGQAVGVIPPDELGVMCRRVLDHRPQLWSSALLAARASLVEGRDDTIALLEKAIERFPSVPRLYLDLADAARARGDGQRESAALAAVERLNPAWLDGALQASASVEQSRDPSRARATLKRCLRFNPRSAELLLALARLEFTHGSPAIALEQAQRAVTCEPESRAAWMTYADFASHVGRKEDVLRLAEELSRERPWNGKVWLRIAEVHAFFGENQASIARLRRALSCQPNDLAVLDSLAETLAGVGLRDEALAVCDRTLSNFFASGALRARRAWVLWRFAEHEAACAAMEAVLREHPDQQWGAQHLTEWCSQLGQHARAATCARELIRLAPLRPASHAFLADALSDLGDNAGAWDALTQAARLDPSYVYAGTRRVRLALEHHRTDDAERVIEEQGAHVAPAVSDYWRLSVACARQDSTAAAKALRALATRPSTRGATVEACAEKLSALGPRRVDDCVKPLLDEPQSHPALGALWVRARAQSGKAVSLVELRALRTSRGGAFEHAVAAHLELLGDQRATWLRVLVTLLALGSAPRRSDLAWGKAGYALVAARAYVAAELWLSDYRRRPGAEAWMVSNHCSASLENYRPRAALAAAEYALSLPTDDTLPQLLTLAAFGRATSGAVEAARELLTGRAPAGLSPRDAKLFLASEELVQLATGAPDEKREALGVLRSLDFTTSGLKGADLASGGTLQRQLAAGVLRQRLDVPFWLTRWAPLLIAGLVTSFVVLAPENARYSHAVVWGWIVVMVLAVFRYKS